MCYVLKDIQHIDGTKGSLVCKICNRHWSLITRIVFRFILDRTPFFTLHSWAHKHQLQILYGTNGRPWTNCILPRCTFQLIVSGFILDISWMFEHKGIANILFIVLTIVFTNLAKNLSWFYLGCILSFFLISHLTSSWRMSFYKRIHHNNK